MTDAMVRFIDIGDLEIACRDVGEGAPIVLFHGAEGDHRVHNLLQDALATSFRVLAFDQRDCGGTRFRIAEPSAYALRDVAFDAIKLLDAVGLERANLVGLSLGGLLAQTVAVHWPERVERLVLGVTWPGSLKLQDLNPEGRHTRERLSGQGARSERLLAEFMSTPEFVAAHPEIVVQLRELRTMPSEPARQRRFAALADAKPIDPGAIPHDTLVLAGERDQVAPPELSAQLAGLIPRARLEIIPEVGHLASRQVPHTLATLIKAFLDAR